MRFFITSAIAIICLSACAPIQHTADIAQPVNAQLTAGPGDVLVRVDKKRNLTNAFGGSDIFGRKTDEGFSELCFGGVDPDGTITLYRRGASILTNETTMSRSGLSQSFSSANGNASIYGNNASFNGTEATTTINAPTDYHVAVPTSAMAIRLPKGTVTVPFEGYTVELVSAFPTSISYRVYKSASSPNN